MHTAARQPGVQEGKFSIQERERERERERACASRKLTTVVSEREANEYMSAVLSERGPDQTLIRFVVTEAMDAARREAK